MSRKIVFVIFVSFIFLLCCLIKISTKIYKGFNRNANGDGGILKKNEITYFSITTGSGRSNRKYTIEITPTK